MLQVLQHRHPCIVLCHSTMSAPFRADCLALVVAVPVLVGELETGLASLRAENTELWRQFNRHSGNSGQSPRRTVRRRSRTEGRCCLNSRPSGYNAGYEA